MAKKKDIALADSVKDPESGKIIRFSDEEKQSLLFCERQMKVGFMQVAIALKTIRDKRLFLLRECDSMRQYIEEYVQFSYRHAHRLLYYADTFGTAKADLLESFSQETLFQIAHNPDLSEEIKSSDIVEGEVRLPDGEVVPLEDYVRRITREARKEIEKKEEKLQRRIDVMSAELKSKNQAIAHYEQALTDENERSQKLEKTIETISVRKDLDAHILTFITHKKEAIRFITEATPQVLDLLGRIDGIPRDLVDTELAGQVSFFVAAVEAAVQRLRENYQPYFWIPGKNQRPDDVVPEIGG